MRRAAPAILLMGLLAGVFPAQGRSPDPRWIVFVRGDGEGSLVAVRSGGRDERTLLGSGVVDADAAGPGSVDALIRDTDGISLVRVAIPSGTVRPARATGNMTSLASAGARVAVERRAEMEADAPRHLGAAVEELAAARVTVLAPPRRPPGTTHTVASASGRSYELRFTNDPEGELSHAEQVNVFVSASPRGPGTPPGAMPVEVRGTEGLFSCGASACFLDWREGPSYAVGEFGRPEDAIDFAESLRPMEELAGPFWREGSSFPVPELVVLGGPEPAVLESVEGFCECSFRPVDWDDAGERLLVVTRAEGFTAVTEYGRADGPEVLHEAAGSAILDAAYTPDGAAVLESTGPETPGTVRLLEGEVLARDVLSFDVEGSTMAAVRGNGDVVVLDLETGDGRRVGTGATSVSLVPRGGAPTPGESPTPEEPARPGPDDPVPLGRDEGIPLPLGFAIAGAAAILIVAGMTLIVAARRR